ncbi:winged helix-turn-helix transcriptional regulator [Bosea beijingensis]
MVLTTMTYQPKRPPLDPCPAEEVISIISGKWKARILLLISQGHTTFSALAKMLPGAPDQVLATQLKGLIDDGILTKSAPTLSNGSGSEYSLTKEGQSLMTLLDAISEWGMARLTANGAHWSPPQRRSPPSEFLG